MKLVPLILIFFLLCFQGFPAIHFVCLPSIIPLISNSDHKGAVFYNYLRTQTGCHGVVGTDMLNASSFFIFGYEKSLRNILNPISKEPFDSHYSTTSDLLRCNDHYPVKVSCRSRAAASGNTVVASFFWKSCFLGGLNSIYVLWGLKNKYYKSNMSWGLFTVDSLGRNPSLTHSLPLSSDPTLLLYMKDFSPVGETLCHYVLSLSISSDGSVFFKCSHFN